MHGMQSITAHIPHVRGLSQPYRSVLRPGVGVAGASCGLAPLWLAPLWLAPLGRGEAAPLEATGHRHVGVCEEGGCRRQVFKRREPSTEAEVPLVVDAKVPGHRLDGHVLWALEEALALLVVAEPVVSSCRGRLGGLRRSFALAFLFPVPLGELVPP